MKCDELEKFDAASNADLSAGYDHRYAYDADEVDAAIAELKMRNVMFHDEAKYYKAENRRLKRALWLTRAERAEDRARIFYFSDLESVLDIDGFSYDSKKKKCCKKLTARLWRIIWLKVERTCRDKAEEYR